MVYIDIKEKEFLKLKEDARKYAIECLGKEDVEDSLTFSDHNMDMKEGYSRIDEVKDDGTLVCTFENRLGYFSFDLKLDDDDFIEFIKIIQKRMNKFKSVIESLK